jgi:NitT/TauT family transport system permease protein
MSSGLTKPAPALASPRLDWTGLAAAIRRPEPIQKAIAISIPIAIVIAWQIASDLGLTNVAMLPSPMKCLEAWHRWAFGQATLSLDSYSGTWGANVINSLTRVIQGFALASALGISIGILIGWNRWFAVFDSTIQVLRPIPITAWLPFSIALFGIKDASAIFLITLGAFYPIVVSATQGARRTNEQLVRAALMLGSSSFYLLRRVVIPSALPTIFVGLRLGVGVCWTAVVIAEMVSVKSGLGYVLWDAYYLGRMDIVIADMVSIGLLGFISDLLIVWVAARLIKWK